MTNINKAKWHKDRLDCNLPCYIHWHGWYVDDKPFYHNENGPAQIAIYILKIKTFLGLDQLLMNNIV
jgi:hypothetical protein